MNCADFLNANTSFRQHADILVEEEKQLMKRMESWLTHWAKVKCPIKEGTVIPVHENNYTYVGKDMIVDLVTAERKSNSLNYRWSKAKEYAWRIAGTVLKKDGTRSYIHVNYCLPIDTED